MLKKKVLTIAGSDSGGGAGIQADLKTMEAHHVFGMSAICALTAQNTMGVRGIYDVTPDFLKQQLEAIEDDLYPDAIKIGMVSQASLIEVIALFLESLEIKVPVILDPVMVSTSGHDLLAPTAKESLMRRLMPLATLITPNVLEAQVLAGCEINNKEDMEIAAKKLSDIYGNSVLIKGGHNIEDASDLLIHKGVLTWFNGERIETNNTHGTGCTLSSAIASNMALGFSLAEAIEQAKTYISGALQWGLDLGEGQGPLNHAWMTEKEHKDEHNE